MLEVSGNEATMSVVVQCQGMILQFHGIQVEAHTITTTQNSLAIITAHSTETTYGCGLAIVKPRKFFCKIFTNGLSTKNFATPYYYV